MRFESSRTRDLDHSIARLAVSVFRGSDRSDLLSVCRSSRFDDSASVPDLEAADHLEDTREK